VFASRDITALLVRLKSGDEDAGSELVRRIYPQLHGLAARCLRGERPGHSMQPTVLVNEVYLRLIGKQKVDWQSRSHFFAVAGRVMRRILVDYARSRNAAKRGGGGAEAPLDNLPLLTNEQSGLVLAVHECLERLSELDKRQAQVVEMRFFGGLTEEEIANVLDISPRTVKRDWSVARAWLHAELKR
jgi:RNA polymerase sigma-70 factor (ECF subfamily)